MKNNINKSGDVVVKGRLYGWKNTILRAGKITNNGLRHYRAHNMLHGFLKDSEVETIPKSAVLNYLEYAK